MTAIIFDASKFLGIGRRYKMMEHLTIHYALFDIYLFPIPEMSQQSIEDLFFNEMEKLEDSEVYDPVDHDLEKIHTILECMSQDETLFQYRIMYERQEV